MTPLQPAGTGTATHHHGEILQGACTRAGALTPCLVTLPVGRAGSTARYTRTPHGTLQVLPPWKTKAQRAACLTLELLGQAPAGLLQIESPLATGMGLGSSSCDVVAAIRAVCAACDRPLSADRLARIAVQAEEAVDPIMFDGEVVLFAQRQGEVLESFGEWIPSFTVLSLDLDPARGGIETLSLPLPQYTRAELALLESLIDSLREALRRRDAAAVARVASASATLNQRYLPMSRFAELWALAERHGALGVQISHSGTLAGILFDPRDTLDNEVVARASADLPALGLRPLGLLVTGAQAPPLEQAPHPPEPRLRART